MFKIIIISFILIATGTYVWYSNHSLESIKAQKFEEQVVLNLTAELNDLESKTVVLQKIIQKKYVLIHFWATWCGPCEAEFPELIKFSDKNAKKLDAIYVAVNDESIKVKKFVQKYVQKNLKIYIDNNQVHQNLFNVYKLPESFLFDAESGKLLKRFVGPQEWKMDYFSQTIQSLP